MRSPTASWAFSLLILAGAPAMAQNDIGPKVDQIVNKAMTDESIPGMAVAVISEGNILFEKAYGIRSVNSPAKTDEHTVFSIGSVSKAFTAVGVMQLVQEGKIALDDAINKYMDGLPAAWQTITIRQFMTHTSGIPELKGKNDPDFGRTLAAAAQLPMSFQPGARQQYNNFNFAVMGKLIEAVSGLDYLSYMQQRVFKPAGMVSTGIDLSGDDISTGHLERNGRLEPVVSHFKAGDYGLASGGLQTDLADFIQLSQALYRKQLLRAAMLNAMWTPYSARLTNTPGWHSRMAGSLLVIHKGGGGTGIGSLCDYKIVPSRNLYVVVMINKDKIRVSPDEITDEILLQCFNIPSGGKEDGED